MKKIILLAALLVSTLSMNAQEFNVGLSGALPVGDAEETTNFGINLDVNYLWMVSEKFDAGLKTGYHYYFGNDIVTPVGTLEEDFEFLPIAAAGRLNVNENFSLGADVGYAIGVSPDGNDGGFYYSPKVLYGVTEAIDVVASFQGITRDEGSFNSITLGLKFDL